MIIDATDLIVGRLTSIVAKKAILGEKIDIINAEKAVITGTRQQIVDHYKHKRSRGGPTFGPFIPKKEDRFVRRIIRGMLPHKQEKGRKAFRNVMCHIGVPEEFQNKKAESFPEIHISQTKSINHVSVHEVCRLL